MKHGHSFSKMHGFTGSADHETDFRPSIPGYKRGGKVKGEASGHAVEDSEHMVKHMKRGGKAKKHKGK